MRIVGVTGVAKSISGALLLIAIAGALQPGAAGTIVRPVYPQDELLFDLIVRTSRDPDLLTPRQIALQDRLQRMGVDAILDPRRPDIGTALGARMMERVRHDRWAPPRVRTERRWDRATGLVVTWEISEATLFADQVDTNVAGVVVRTPPDAAQPGVRVRVDDLDRYLVSTSSIALQKELGLQLRNRQAAQAGSGELLNFTIPIRLPRTLERIIGKGEATNIRISGTQRISIGGQSTVSDNFVATELRQSQSLFPQLEFSQTLRVNLDGTVGEKIKVRISHDSEAIGAQSTEVRLSFEGDEDDIIQQIRAGDIDVTLPGSRLLGVGTGRGGLFGLKVQGAMGPVEFTVVTSKENARQGNQTFSQSGGTDAQQQFTIPSVNYIPSRFFRLTAPVSYYFTDTDSFPQPLQDTRSFSLVVSEQNENAPWEIDYASLEVYRTAGPGLSTEETIDGAIAYLDSTGIGFEGFGPGGAGRTPGDGDGTSTYPESGFDPAQALAGLPRQYRERWQRLRRDDEWRVLEVNSRIIGIQLKRPALEEEVIGVSYNLVDVETREIVRRVGRSSEDGESGRIVDPENPGRTINYFKLLKPGTPNQPVVSGNYTELALTWEYEYRNFYDLLGRDIDPNGFEFSIESKDRSLENPDILPDTQLRFVTIFGLDQRKSNNVAGSDGFADVTDVTLFSLEDGFLRFDHPTPMALPDSVVAEYTDGALTALPDLYKVPTLYTRLLTSRERAELHRLDFVGSQTSVSSRLRLNAFNILEGSEEVLLDGELMTRGQDYDIDYLSGEINLKGDALARLNSQTRIEVRFESDPLFGGGRTSLSGANLQWNFGRNNLLSTTWLYQTRPNSQTKIRFGEEPKKNLVGNLQTRLRFDPGWTRGISDLLSRENVQQNASMIFDAEVAMSVPNPNTRNEAYLDDFESADQATQIPLVREGWWWASLPVRGPDESGLQREAFQPEDRAYQGWHRVPEGSLQRGYTNPDLSEAESREIYTTMELRMVAKDPSGWADDEYAGIMRGLGEVDLSRSQYLEFWIDDGTGYVDPRDPAAVEERRPGRLHFDFGQINEDFFWKVDENGNFILGQWDKEDTDNDGLLGIAIDGQTEDRGLDGLLNSQESPLQALPGRPSRAPEDPAGDDRDAVDTGDNTFIYINGTEQNQRLDSEDISFNNTHDRVDGFFRLTLELDDEAFVDPARDYANNPGFIEDLRQNNRSWRKYRLDLRQLKALQRGMDTNEPTVYGPAVPDLSRVRIFRIWYEPEGDGTDPAERRISFSEMRFLGNRWVADGIRDPYDKVIPTSGDSVITTEDFRLGVLNNKENADYVPPIPVRVRNNVAELEQSLQFTYTDLQPGHRFRAKKDAGSRGEDYLDYGEFNFFWRIPFRDGAADPMQTDAEGYFWIGVDSTSYYEISVPFGEVTSNANGWVEVSVALADLTNVKNSEPDSLVRYPDPGRDNPEVFRGRVRDTQTRNVYDVTVRGRPDLKTVQNYYVGVRYRQPDPAAPLPPPYSGEVLFNELRLRDVNRKAGYAQRYAANFTFPGLGEVSGEFSNVDEEFRGLDRERGSGVERRDYAIRGSTRLQNFLPLFGIEVPVQLSHRVTEELPKYAPRTDIELPVDARSEFVSRRVQQSFSLQFRKRQPSPRWWLKYTIDPFAFQMSGGRTRNDRPERRSRNQTLNWTYSYDLNLRKVPSVGVPFTRSRFTWLPNQLTTNSRWNYTRNLTQDTGAGGEVFDPTIQATRQMTNDATLRWRPFESLPVTWVVTSVRNLLLAENPAYRDVLGDGRWLGINVGFEVRYSESLAMQYRPNFRWINWARPNIDLRAGYNEDRNPLRRQQATAPEFDTVGDGRTGVPTEVRTVGNSRDVTLRAELALVSWVRRFISSQGPSVFGLSLRQADVADTTGTVEEGGGGIPDFLGRTLKGLSRGFWDLRPISLNVQHKQASSFTHVNGRADLAYRLGITDEPDFSGIEPLGIRRLEGGEVLLQDYSAFQQTIQRSVRMNSQTSLSDNLRLDGSFDWSRNNTRRFNSGDNYTRRMEWPNLTLRMANVQAWRLFEWMGRPLESSDVSVNYRRSVSASGREGDPREYPSRQWAWQPRWNARLTNGIDTSLTVARNGETRESAGQGTLENRQLSLTARLDKKFDARGRMSFLRFGQSGVGSTIDMTLSVSWTNNSNWRERNGIRDQDRSSTRLSIDPQFTYQFTRNLRGSLRLNYSRSALTVSTTQSLGVFFDAVLNF